MAIQRCTTDASACSLELSFQPLYEGGMLIREAPDLADSLGFTLSGLQPGFTDSRTVECCRPMASSSSD